MTILRHYTMTAADGQGAALANALVDLAGKVRPLPGCEKVELTRDAEDENVYVFVETWASSEDHKAAGATLGKAAFAPIMAVLARAPEGRYLEPVPIV